MKNTIIVFMNILLIMVIAADIVSVKYNCDTKIPKVTKSAYHEIQTQVLQTADITNPNNYKL